MKHGATWWLVKCVVRNFPIWPNRFKKKVPHLKKKKSTFLAFNSRSMDSNGYCKQLSAVFTHLCWTPGWGTSETQCGWCTSSSSAMVMPFSAHWLESFFLSVFSRAGRLQRSGTRCRIPVRVRLHSQPTTGLPQRGLQTSPAAQVRPDDSDFPLFTYFLCVGQISRHNQAHSKVAFLI